MARRVWIGGGNNSVYNPNDWSPAGEPQPGDGLFIPNGVANMVGGNLAGDTLIMYWQTFPPPPLAAAPVVNLFDGADLKAESGSIFTPVHATINVFGRDTLDATIYGTSAGSAGTYLTVDIHHHAVLNGSFDLAGGVSSVEGSGALHNQDSTVLEGSLTITPAMIGTGQTDMQFASTLDVGGSVSRGQAFSFEGRDASLTIEHLSRFHGTVSDQSSAGPDNKIDLLGVHADSYTLSDHVLRLFSASNEVVGRLRLDDQANSTFVGQGAAGVLVGLDLSSPPGGYTQLPVHS